VPQKAKPLFGDKLLSMIQYLQKELNCPCSSKEEKFMMLRDKAFFTMQFFSGDHRAYDLTKQLIQEIRCLPNGAGIILRQDSRENGKLFPTPNCDNL